MNTKIHFNYLLTPYTRITRVEVPWSKKLSLKYLLQVFDYFLLNYVYIYMYITLYICIYIYYKPYKPHKPYKIHLCKSLKVFSRAYFASHEFKKTGINMCRRGGWKIVTKNGTVVINSRMKWREQICCHRLFCKQFTVSFFIHPVNIQWKLALDCACINLSEYILCIPNTWLK